MLDTGEGLVSFRRDTSVQIGFKGETLSLEKLVGVYGYLHAFIFTFYVYMNSSFG